MLKDYMQKCNISIYSLAKKSGVAYSTLNDLANGKVEIGKCTCGMLRSLSDALGMTMDELYSKASERDMAIKTRYGVDVAISVRNKSYYSEFEYEGSPVVIRLCKVNEGTTFYREFIARARAEEYIRHKRMTEF